MGKQIKGILGTKLGMTQIFTDALAKCPATGLGTRRGSISP